MTKLAYHASHEQFAPSHLLRLAQLAENAGFDAIHSSDHFNPWSERQGHSGFSFSWVASVLQATALPVGMICTPGQRYHPAVVAQAIATIAEMYPGRLTVEMATGENLNESITGDKWPSKTERNKRLEHSVIAIRKLLAGETVSTNNSIRMIGAKVWSLPDSPPPLYCAAISNETAGWCGSWADGLITVAGSRNETKEKIDAFYSNGGKGKPVSVQYSFSYAKNKDLALEAAYEQWRSNLLPREQLADLSNTLDFDRVTENISREEVEEKVPLITSMDKLHEELDKLEGIGISLISLHNVNRNHEEFIEDFKNGGMLK
ncbi:MAG: TIGR03885 family FMN-dependent LLM class oxidoreductase [Flavitalea sp.]